MESERDRLERLYRELSDEHLKDLADAPEDLTGDARLVLVAEMRRRGFASARAVDSAEISAGVERESGFSAGIPGMFPSSAATVEQALEPGGEQRTGWVGLAVFYDGHELTRACEALEVSGIGFAIEEKAGDALAGAPGSFEIWVEADSVDEAQQVLRKKVGLFPLPELDAAEGKEETGVLGTFETRAEAEEVQQVLTEAGIASSMIESEADERDSWWTVEVQTAEQDRALNLVASRLELEQ